MANQPLPSGRKGPKDMMQVLFWILAALLIAGGLTIVVKRSIEINPLHIVKGAPAIATGVSFAAMGVLCAWASMNTASVLRFLI